MNKIAPASKIVIVEDNPMYRELLVHHFEQKDDFEIVAFPDAESCLAGLDSSPAAFLLDYHLGDQQRDRLNGLQLFRKLRSKGLGAPALFLSGQSEVQPAIEMLKAGAFDYMRKEFSDLHRISDRVNQMVRWPQLQLKIDLQKVELRKRIVKTAILGGLFVGLIAAVLWVF